MTLLHAFGDSITVGAYVQPSEIWAAQLAASLGLTLASHALASSQAADQGNVAQGLTLGSGNAYAVMLGVNDLTVYGNDATKRTAYIDHLRGLLIWLSCPTRVIAHSGGMTKVGGWTDYNAIGAYSYSAGDKATGSITGAVAYVGFRNQNNTDTAGAQSEIRSDGTLKTTRLGNGQTVGNTGLGAAYGPQVTRVPVGAGAHSIEVKNALGGKATLLEYVAGDAGQAENPTIYVVNIPLRNPDLAYRADYNSALAAMVAELVADGRDIRLVDIANAMTNADLYSDGIHLLATGHAKIASIAIGIAPTTMDFQFSFGGTLHLQLNTQGKVSTMTATP